MAFFVAFDAIRDVPERPSTCPRDLSPRLELRCLLGLNTGIGDHGAPPSEEGAPRLVSGGRSSAPKEPNGEQHSEAVTAPIVRGCGVPGGPWPRLPSPVRVAEGSGGVSGSFEQWPDHPKGNPDRGHHPAGRPEQEQERTSPAIVAVVPEAVVPGQRSDPRRDPAPRRQATCDRVALLIREEEIGDRCHECHPRDEREEHPVRDGGRELRRRVTRVALRRSESNAPPPTR
jgi:hypothetical protein